MADSLDQAQESVMNQSILSKVMSDDSFKIDHHKQSLPGAGEPIIYDPEEEKRLWNEFKQHFRNTSRKKTV